MRSTATRLADLVLALNVYIHCLHSPALDKYPQRQSHPSHPSHTLSTAPPLHACVLSGASCEHNITFGCIHMTSSCLFVMLMLPGSAADAAMPIQWLQYMHAVKPVLNCVCPGQDAVLTRGVAIASRQRDTLQKLRIARNQANCQGTVM